MTKTSGSKSLLNCRQHIPLDQDQHHKQYQEALSLASSKVRVTSVKSTKQQLVSLIQRADNGWNRVRQKMRNRQNAPKRCVLSS